MIMKMERQDLEQLITVINVKYIKNQYIYKSIKNGRKLKLMAKYINRKFMQKRKHKKMPHLTSNQGNA